MDDAFLAALEQPSAGTPGGRCTVRLMLNDMPSAHRDAINHELDAIVDARQRGVNYRHTVAGIAKIMTEHGYRISPKSLNRHVRRECNCG